LLDDDNQQDEDEEVKPEGNEEILYFVIK